MKKPIEIKRLEGALEIAWSDGSTHRIPAEQLRKSCPCATCREARGDGAAHQKPLTGGSKPSSLRIVTSSRDQEVALKRIWSVGGYAIGVEWGDGHASGIYPFKLLEELCLSQAAAPGVG